MKPLRLGEDLYLRVAHRGVDEGAVHGQRRRETLPLQLAGRWLSSTRGAGLAIVRRCDVQEDQTGIGILQHGRRNRKRVVADVFAEDRYEDRVPLVCGSHCPSGAAVSLAAIVARPGAWPVWLSAA